MELPGEIRNMIYGFAIYPHLDSVNVVNGKLGEHVGSTTLCLGVFRVSRQIRAEAISFLCASKTVRILGVAAANTFFDCVGTAIRNVRSVVLLQMDTDINSASGAIVDRFFRNLEKAAGLKVLKHVRIQGSIPLGESAEHRAMVRRLKALGANGVRVEMRFGNEDRRWRWDMQT
jgi:hypothetical protein